MNLTQASPPSTPSDRLPDKAAADGKRTVFSDDAPKTDNRRLMLLALVLTFGFAVVVGQLIRYQVFRHDELEKLGNLEAIKDQPLTSDRGTIYDCNGQMLATDVTQWTISAYPPIVYKPLIAETKVALAQVLGMSPDEIAASLWSTKEWELIARQVPEATGEAVADLKIRGIGCEPKSLRAYPAGALTAQVLGMVLDSGDGFYGLESYYNRELKPTPGEEQFVASGGGSAIPGPPLQQRLPKQGTDLVLTLDLNIQHLAEEELRRALELYGAQAGTVIVMNPQTGAVLASVSLPTYDPKNRKEEDAPLFNDPAVAGIWEPGSIFKVITWASGLDAGVINANTQFQDRGVLEVGGRVVVNSDRAAHGLVTAEQGLLYSLNTVAATISTSLGREAFYSYVQRFGFGSVTGVDLADEVGGMLKLPGDENWFPSDLGTNSFGQGIGVTPMQMITAVSAVANKGLLMKPYLVSRFVTPDEAGAGTRVIEVQPQVQRRAVSEAAAATLTRMLVQATEQSSSKARVAGYQIAGKTGTAQVPAAGGYHPTDTVQSFIGYAPADDPQFAVLVKLDKPSQANWASDSAAPVFAAIAQRLFLYLQIPPDDIRLASAGSN